MGDGESLFVGSNIQPAPACVFTSMKLTHILLTVALACAAMQAHAHDTWFEKRSADGSWLALGTGNQFPQMETALPAPSLARSGCNGADGSALPLPPQGQADASLLLRAPARAHSCWAQSQAFEVEIASAKVTIYLHDIQASSEVRAAWAEMLTRGVPWRERYVKHARINLVATSGDAAVQPMPMDIQLKLNDQALQAGSSISAVVLRDGQPLADQPIELRGEHSRYGLWRRSDAQGRVQFTLPLAGRWVLRGTDLRVRAERPDSWDSRFMTLAFDVAAPPLRTASASN
jgi:Domain of unknown function (DUF4198)